MRQSICQMKRYTSFTLAHLDFYDDSAPLILVTKTYKQSLELSQ